MRVGTVRIIPNTASFRDAARKMAALQLAVRRQVMRASLVNASKVLVFAMQVTVPVDTATLKRSLGYKIKLYQRGLVGLSLIGARKGYRVPYHDGYPSRKPSSRYAHLAEFYNRSQFMQRALGLAGFYVKQAFWSTVRRLVP